MINNVKLTRKKVLAVAVSLLVSQQVAAAPAANKAAVEARDPMEAQIVSFEEQQLPDYISASASSKIALTDTRFINGEQSLVWGVN